MKVLIWCLRLAAVAAACKTEMDCQLNGICKQGSCVCDSGWRGTECDELDLLPAASLTPAYGGIMANHTTSWGGSVVQSESGSFHMFVAEMANSCGMTTWATNSIIRHAVASAPEGPYQAREVVMPPFAHNPTALRAPVNNNACRVVHMVGSLVHSVPSTVSRFFRRIFYNLITTIFVHNLMSPAEGWPSG